MSDIKEELEILEDDYKELKWKHKKEKRELIEEFTNSIQKWLEGNITEYEYLDDQIEYWINEKKKWEELKDVK